MARKKNLEWQDERRISEQIVRGPWGEWVRSAKKPKDLVAAEVERRLANRLGLPQVPKGTGLMSFGWIVSKLLTHHHSIMVPQDDPVVTTLSQLGGNERGGREITQLSRLVLTLMVHRECITKHAHNCFYYHGSDEDRLHLYEDHWSALNEEVLAWAMQQSPFSQLTDNKDEWISEIHTHNGRLHNTDGIAVRTTKNRGLYALNGVTMTYEEFKLRGAARAILDVTNVEVRRVLVEDMGAENFIKACGLKPHHSDETGMLYRLEDGRKDAWNIRHLCWVHVVCPSTDREYMLAVPPNTRTAREGVAWTFRKLPEEYQPGQET